MIPYLTKRKWITVNSGLLGLLVFAIFFALETGSGEVGLFQALNGNDRAHAIVFLARLPRTLMAALVGLALASSGGAFQAILRNPLADPFILGISGGAALGSVVAIGLHLPFVWISVIAFIGALTSMLIIFAASGIRSRFESNSLLLTGVIFNAFAFAMILFINAVVTMEEAYQIIFILIGNLEVTDMTTVCVVAIFVLGGFAVLCLFAQKINVLSLGDTEAASLGINTKRIRAIIFCAASFVVGAAVAASGLIGFIGLFVPHIVRLIFGADNRLVIPASGLFGAAFLVLADSLARTVLMNTHLATQLPVGVVTAIVGAPIFMFLLRREMKQE